MIDKVIITIVCLLLGFMFGWYGNQISSTIKSRKKTERETLEIQKKIYALQEKSE